MDEPNTVEGDVIAHPAKAPPLPAELLLCIFHHATHVPGTLVPDIYDNANILGPIFIKQFHPALRKALITKCALVRVCRQWWHLAAPILYTSVYISGAHCVPSLYRTLQRSAEGKGTVVGTRPLGEYTQRLDIVSPFGPEDQYSNSDCYLMRKLIIHCMRHLAIFSITATACHANPALPYIVLNKLGWSAKSLRVLDWSSPTAKPVIPQIDYILDSCSQLRVLNCPGVHWSWETGLVSIPPTVTTLRLHTMVQSHSPPQYNIRAIPVPLPALQELILDFSGGGGSYHYLLDTYGHQLVSVHLYRPGTCLGELRPSLHMLAQTCPNLRRLTITSSEFTRSMSKPMPVCGPLTNIDYLGLRVDYSSQLYFGPLFAFLEYMRPRMPSLQVVQLLDEPSTRCFLENHTKRPEREFSQFMEANATVRLEDTDGVLLTDRLKALEQSSLSVNEL